MEALTPRYEALSRMNDPLERLNKVVDWSIFKPLLDRAFLKRGKSAVGRKPYHRLLMFKLLVLQQYYNLSDHQVEYQVRDRLSFMRFLGLGLEDAVPDEKTLWRFRELLVEGKVMDKLFMRLDKALRRRGFSSQSGSIVDASIIRAPIQRNTRSENAEIKRGEVPSSFKKKPTD